MRLSFSRAQAIASILSAFLLVVLVWSPFLSAGGVNNGYKDWTFRANYTSYAINAVFTKLEIPYWATLKQYEQLRTQGNHGFFSNPETEVLSPYLVLYRLFPFVQAAKLSLLIHLFIGVCGIYLLYSRALPEPRGTKEGDPGQTRGPESTTPAQACGPLRSGRPAGVSDALAIALLSLLLFSSGFLYSHMIVGHLQFIVFAYLPMILFLYQRSVDCDCASREGWSYRLSAAFLLALCLYEGGIHILVHALIFLSIYGLVQAVISGTRGAQFVLNLGILVVGFVLLSAWKLLPMIAEYSGYRSTYVVRYTGLSDFLACVQDSEALQTLSFGHEKNVYLGTVGLAVVAMGYLYLQRKTLALVATGACFLLLSFCPFPQSVRALPILNTQGVFSRFGGMALFAGVCAAAVLLREVSDTVSNSSLRPVREGLKALLVLLCLLLAHDQHKVLQERVTSHCTDRPSLPRALIRAPAFQALDPEQGSVSSRIPEINSFSYHYQGRATAEQPVTVYSPELEGALLRNKLALEGEGRLTSYEGHLAVELSQSDAEFTLRYSSPFQRAGMVISLSSMAGFGVFWRVSRRRSRFVADAPASERRPMQDS